MIKATTELVVTVFPRRAALATRRCVHEAPLWPVAAAVFVFSACTVDTTIDGRLDAEDAVAESGEKQLQDYRDKGMPQDHAEACVVLGEWVAEINGRVKSHEPPSGAPSTNTLSDNEITILSSHSAYCAEYEPERDAHVMPMWEAWEVCAEPNNGMIDIEQRLTDGEAARYVTCLAAAGIDSANHCEHLAQRADSLGQLAATDPQPELWCPRGGTGLDGQPSGKGALSKSFEGCPDGHTYRFTCYSPNESCDMRCDCESYQKQHNVELAAVSVDEHFVGRVWSACGFPSF